MRYHFSSCGILGEVLVRSYRKEGRVPQEKLQRPSNEKETNRQPITCTACGQIVGYFLITPGRVADSAEPRLNDNQSCSHSSDGKHKFA